MAPNGRARVEPARRDFEGELLHDAIRRFDVQALLRRIWGSQSDTARSRCCRLDSATSHQERRPGRLAKRMRCQQSTATTSANSLIRSDRPVRHKWLAVRRPASGDARLLRRRRRCSNTSASRAITRTPRSRHRRRPAPPCGKWRPANSPRPPSSSPKRTERYCGIEPRASRGREVLEVMSALPLAEQLLPPRGPSSGSAGYCVFLLGAA